MANYTRKRRCGCMNGGGAEDKPTRRYKTFHNYSDKYIIEEYGKYGLVSSFGSHPRRPCGPDHYRPGRRKMSPGGGGGSIQSGFSYPDRSPGRVGGRHGREKPQGGGD